MNHKGVTKSYNPAINAPERVEIPKEITQLPINNKRWRSTDTKHDSASCKQQRKQRKKPSETIAPHPSLRVHSNLEAGTSENPDTIVLGNHELSPRDNEISTNYIDSGESYIRKTTIVDTYFSTKIANNLISDPDPKTMAECKQRSDWNQWKDAIQAEIVSLNKREVFTKVIPTPPNVFPVGFKQK